MKEPPMRCAPSPLPPPLPRCPCWSTGQSPIPSPDTALLPNAQGPSFGALMLSRLPSHLLQKSEFRRFGEHRTTRLILQAFDTEN